MSVSFRPDRPADLKPVAKVCDLCDGTGHDWQDETRPCYGCEGTGEVVDFDLPEINMGNETAEAVLLALGIPGAVDYGSVNHEGLPALIQRAIVLLNRDGAVAPFTVEGFGLPAGHAGVRVTHEGNIARIERMGAEVHSFGVGEDRILHRVRELVDLMVFARTNGVGIHWG